VGFDRTMKGDKYVDQYFPPVRDMFDSLETCPDKFLLWFHRLSWDYKMKSGKTLWEEICGHYNRGLKEVAALRETWAKLEGKVDPARYKAVLDRLDVQVRDANTWRNNILRYFSGINGKAIIDA